jgi:mono/diheme cytochrome c family protein
MMQVALALAWVSFTMNPQEPPADTVDFARDIRPILEEHCLRCHGAEKQKGQLRLDSKSRGLVGGVSGTVILPGKGHESRLVQLLLEPNPDERMPQKAPPLRPEQIALIQAWIDQGAVWTDPASAQEGPEKHWAYVSPTRHELPSVKNASWVRNPVDAFIAAAHETQGLRPRPEALKHVLLRRLYLDLIGLPPTGKEIEAFLADPAPDAYEKAVTGLLEDARYGERWGRHWMDVWRYSDWSGYGKEVWESHPHMWRWRDWIVESLNGDKGYDRMILEMLAGDELAPDEPNTVRATGFLARNWQRYMRNTSLDKMVEHTAKAFLATTINCARCHNHPFDPITQKEYYGFRTFFQPYDVRIDPVPGEVNPGKDGLSRVYDAHPSAPTYLLKRGDERNPDKSRSIAPAVPLVLGGSSLRIEPVLLPRMAACPEKQEFVVEALRAAAERDVIKASEGVEAATNRVLEAQREATSNEEARKALQTALEELPVALLEVPLAKARRGALDATLRVEKIEDWGGKHSEAWTQAAQEASSAQRREALLEARKLLFLAQRQVPKLSGDELAEEEKASTKAERESGEPVTTAYAPRKVRTYPLTSTGRRLALARWIAHPANPLSARVAVNHVWSRHFGQALVPTVFDFGSHGARPSHAALLDWLATEFVREGWSMKKLHRLIVTSSTYRMDSTPDPESLARDPENRHLWRMNPRRMEAEVVRDSVLFLGGVLDPTMGGPDLDPEEGLRIARRSLYFRHAAEKQVEFLVIFDAAGVTECYRRAESIVPQQALAMFNSSLTLEQSGRLARALSEKAEDASTFVGASFLQVLGRPPTEEERAECDRFLANSSRPAISADIGGDGSALRARERVILVLFNHHEFVTIR